MTKITNKFFTLIFNALCNKLALWLFHLIFSAGLSLIICKFFITHPVALGFTLFILLFSSVTSLTYAYYIRKKLQKNILYRRYEVLWDSDYLNPYCPIHEILLILDPADLTNGWCIRCQYRHNFLNFQCLPLALNLIRKNHHPFFYKFMQETKTAP